MKTTIIILLMSMSIQSFSQSGFSKRKYRKGIFIEKISDLKQKKAAKISPPANTLLACQTIIEEKKAPANKDVIIEHDAVIVADSHENVDSIPLTKHAPKAYTNIIKYNTLKLSGEDVYCSSVRLIALKTDHHAFRQKMETQKMEIKVLSNHTHRRSGSISQGIVQGLKNFALWMCIAILSAYLLSAVLTICVAPVASLSWGVAIAVGVYAVIGIIICAMYLADVAMGKFMEYVTLIFILATLVVLFGGEQIGRIMNSYK